MKIKEQVNKCLEMSEETRNSDFALTIAVWLRYYSQHINFIDGEYYIKLANLKEVPSQDAIKRYRAHIQNKEGKYLPTVQSIAIQRGWKELEWKIALGYNV